MNVEPHELGPYRPVSEMQVLAAVERAHRHGDTVPRRDGDMIAHYDIAYHLGFERSGATTRRLLPQLESLREDGSLATKRYKRTDVWTLTARGRGRLAAARRRGTVEPLPESPQHCTWRAAREEAAARIEEIGGAVLATLEEADEVLGGSESPPGDSTRHFEVGRRLQHQFWRLGVAIHCLREWQEPDDTRRDVDPHARRHARRWFHGLKEDRG
ncbi:MAG: hypothetical protein AB7V58_00920 [Solirubrobacterales bacterium]